MFDHYTQRVKRLHDLGCLSIAKHIAGIKKPGGFIRPVLVFGAAITCIAGSEECGGVFL